MNKEQNKLKDIKTILAHVETVLDLAAAGEPASAPVQDADKNPQAMWDLLHNCKASIRGLHACMNSMASDLYGHMSSDKHLPPLHNYDHVDFACRTLGYGKENAVRRLAYASKIEVDLLK